MSNPTLDELAQTEVKPVPRAEGVARTEGGKFMKGHSGNPMGRPVGSKNRHTELREAIELELLEMLQTQSVSILDVAMKRALEGNDAMLKLLLDKVLGSRRSEDQERSKSTPQININISKTDSGDTFIEGEKV